MPVPTVIVQLDGASAKRCAGPCSQVKQLDRFNRSRRQTSGRRSWCRDCETARDDATRAAVFAHYGRACACCGTARKLVIDHMGGGGKEHKRSLSPRGLPGGIHLYRWLVRQGFPAGFQTLCQPCNRSKSDGPACRLHPGRAACCPTCGQALPVRPAR